MSAQDMSYDEVLVLAYTGKEPESPQCRGFHWIGQPMTSCDNCGKPAWEHDGFSRYRTGPFTVKNIMNPDAWTVEPFRPGEADRLRRNWGKPSHP